MQEDSFIYLRELPAELLETVMSCDIREQSNQSINQFGNQLIN